MKSSLKNMILCLGLITLAAAAALGYVYSITKGPIEASKQAKTTAALATVIEEFDNNPADDAVTTELDGMPIKVYTGRKGSAVTGYAVETMTKAGFSGEVKLMVGFKPDGEIYNIEVLEQNETPGLGSKMADDGNPLIVSFQGKNPADLKMSVRKDGGDIDAITASTISSRAYIDAVDRAYRAWQAVALGVVEDKADPVAVVLPAYEEVLPAVETTVDDSPVKIQTAVSGGEVVGYAVTAENAKGYHGVIRLMVGFLPDGTINDIAVLESNETPDFGGKIKDEDNALRLSLKGKKASELKFGLKPQAAEADANSGATSTAAADRGAEGDVDGISGSTVTSMAYVAIVENAWRALETYKNTSDE